MAANAENKLSLSPYTLMNSWLRDGDLNTPIPEACCYPAISQIVILTYFWTSPRFFVYINKLFNCYELFSMPVPDLLKMMKEIVYYTSYKQPYIAKGAKDVQNKLHPILKSKFPYYRNEEISMIIEKIDSDEKLQSVIYEQFDIRQPKKYKTNKKEFEKKKSEILSKDDLLNSI